MVPGRRPRLRSGGRLRVLERRRLPGGDVVPAMVGSGARVGGGAVVCGGCTVGEDAVVGAGEIVEDDVPDGAVWMGGRVSGLFEGKTWD